MGGEGLGRPVSAASVSGGRGQNQGIIGDRSGVAIPARTAMRRHLHLPCELRSYEKLKQDTDEKSHLGVSDELPFLTRVKHQGN